jgi:hypothetical protein
MGSMDGFSKMNGGWRRSSLMTEDAGDSLPAGRRG